MKVRSQILLLLSVIVALFIGGVTAIMRQEAAHAARLTDQYTLDLNLSFDRYVRERGRPLELFASAEFRDWDELVTAVEDRDAHAIQPILNDDTLRAYGANAVWILGPDSGQLYAWNNVPARALNDPDFRTNLHPLLCTAPGGCHYFVMTAEGLMEIRGIALHPGWLSEEEATKAKPVGYFFAGRLLTNRDAEDMGAITGNSVRLINPADETASTQPTGAGVVIFDRDLKGADGRVIARLRVTHVTPVITAFQQATNHLSLSLTVFAVAVLILLAAALQLLVSTPLHVITRALHTRDLALLKPLGRRRSEIGELAGLIADFHAQRDLLVQQMDKRLATEHALEESEEQLRQAQKMEAIGRLAGGVAHDFNNLLTAIIGYSNILSTKPGADPETHRQAATILQAGQQAAGLTRQLLAFSRKQILQPRVIDLNLLVANMENLLRSIIGENIAIRTELFANRGQIKADPHQIEQVVLNLAVNARDAMPQGGSLSLKTSNQKLPGESGKMPAGDCVLLEVADTGHGMDRQTINRIFEPFFTTKGSGKGTGLGLATVYGIVRQSGGCIDVQSKPGEGSTFRIFIPLSNEPIQPVIAPVPPSRTSAAGATILAVDDQKMVASLVADVLRAEGYRVLVAASPSEAINLFRENRIDLLITDMVMPRIDGRTLADLIHARHEKAKVLYISGYADPDSENDTRKTELLFKPFTPDALVRKVNELLGAAGESS